MKVMQQLFCLTTLIISSLHLVSAFSADISHRPSTIKTTTTATTTTASIDQTCDAQTATNMTSKLRSVKKVLPRPPYHWVGDGFKVYPVFANMAFTKEISPLLMFDYGEPTQFPAREGKKPLGVGQHPHRGFETVTIAFQGEVQHRDSTGNSGVIGPGDVQWMTAGRGIIHEEYHSQEFTKTGGTFEMCQLWVNLPKKHKMTKPRYQPILGKDIPEVNLPLGATEPENVIGKARIISGELSDTKGAAKTFTPVQMWDLIFTNKGVEVDLPYPADYNLILFVRRGRAQVLTDESTNGNGAKALSLGPQDIAVMNMDGSQTVRIRVDEPNTSVIFLGGEPIDEPIAARGPFVMNSDEEIMQAMMDYRSGKMGN